MKYLFFLFLLTMCFSCDKLLTEDYIITNEHSEDIIILCENMNGYIINETIPSLVVDYTFYVNTGYGQSVSEDDLSILFKYFIIKTDTIKSRIDYLNNNLWEYSELSETHAVYRLVVDETHFE